MKLSLAAGSLILFGLAVVLLIMLTLFESALLGMSPEAERSISLLGLVLPAVIGEALGVLSLTRREGRAALAIAGIVLNTLFALFHLMVILFAG
jgi:glycopeptide antibiotics resistance protein